MNKKALLITSIAAVFAVGIGTVAISGIEQIQKANEIRATGEHVKTNTKVDFEHISNVQDMVGEENYFTFSASAVSPKGATIYAQEYDSETMAGSFLYSDGGEGSLDYDDGNSYMLKMTYTESSYDSPSIYMYVLIHNRADLYLSESYFLYDIVYNTGRPSEYNQKEIGKLYEENVEVGGEIYNVYEFKYALNTYTVGSYVTIQRLHLEYLC